MSRRARLWLILSLALNALLVGVVIGGGWMVAHQRGRPPAVKLRAAGDGLSPAQQPRFRTLLADTRSAGRPLLREARAARADAAMALVAPSYDATALAQALARARTADLALRQQREEAVARFAATLSVDDRRALAAGLRRGMLRGPRRLADPR